MTEAVLSLARGLSAPAWWALAVAIVMHAAAIVLHTIAWRTILAHEYGESNVRWRDVFSGYAAGSALNAFLPARAGGIVKLHIVKTRIAGATYATVIATLGALVVFDALVTIAIVVWAVRTTLLPDLATLAHYEAFFGRVVVTQPVWTAAAVLALGGLLLALALFARRRLRGVGLGLARGFRVFSDPGFYATRILPVQVLNWVVQLAALGFFLHAFGLPATPKTVLLAQAAKSLALLIPFTPSGAGAQFALLMLAFGRRFPAMTVSTFAVGMRVATTAFNVAVGAGALAFLFETVRWRRILRQACMPLAGHRTLATGASRGDGHGQCPGDVSDVSARADGRKPSVSPAGRPFRAT